MSEYSFFTPAEELRKNPYSIFSKGCEMRDEEGIFVTVETKMDVLKKIIPPCFELFVPFVNLYIIKMPNNNFGTGYNEVALMVPVMFDGVPGVYFRSVFLYGPGTASGTFIGREGAGFPKKPCDIIEFTRQGDYFHGYAEKDGVRFLDIEAKLGEYNTPAGAEMYAANEKLGEVMGTMYLIKWDLEQKEDGHCQFENARMYSNYADTTWESWTPATANVTLKSCANAPWGEIEIVNVLGGGYGVFGNHNSSIKRIAELNAEELEPYMVTAFYDCGYVNGFEERSGRC